MPLRAGYGIFKQKTESFVFWRISEISARNRRQNDRTDVAHLFCQKPDFSKNKQKIQKSSKILQNAARTLQNPPKPWKNPIISQKSPKQIPKQNPKIPYNFPIYPLLKAPIPSLLCP